MRVKRHRVVAQLAALVAIFSVVRFGQAAPGDVFSPGAGFAVTGNMLDASPPKGAELHDGDASVATQTGALDYSYPIQVPPGRLGNEPKLALSYSSQAPIYGGIAAGWSLSIPEIDLDTSDGVLPIYHYPFAEKHFVSTMAGSRPLVETGEQLGLGVGWEGYLQSGKRWPGTSLWPTVDSMLLDLDGDGLVDRLVSTGEQNANEDCRIDWYRNSGQGFGYGGTFYMPRLPWHNLGEQADIVAPCALNRQISFVHNVDPGQCDTSAGSILAYRWLDMNGDGLPDLVGAIHADVHAYDPNLDTPFGAWPSCDGSEPESVLADYRCLDSHLACPPQGEGCEMDPTVFQDCIETAPREPGYTTMTCGRDPQQGCEVGHHDCSATTLPQERCGGYPWMIWWNQGNGQIAQQSEIVTSPIPLESDNGDSPSGGHSIVSSWHAITDVDGDGYLDAAMDPFHYDPAPPAGSVQEWWYVWRGDGTGHFTGAADGRPFVWAAPAYSKPSMSDVEWSHWEAEQRQILGTIGTLADFNGDGLTDLSWRTALNDLHGAQQIYWNTGHGFFAGSAVAADVTVTTATNLHASEWSGRTVLSGTAEKLTMPLDYDGDGRVDLRWTPFDPSTGTIGTGQMRFNAGTSLLPWE